MIETGDLKMNKPLVSVILPTYNTEEEYLKEAIDSILCQMQSFLGSS